MKLHWDQNETTLTLLSGNRVVWRLNFDPREGKPYFHPITAADGAGLTALRPADHPWHRGIWWSWKFINGLNYWEENKEGLSDGRTRLRETQITTRPDGSATIGHRLEYHPPEKPPVLTEHRQLVVSPGGQTIDWHSHFTVGVVPVRLDRTPVPGEPNGQSWGGYAGLSVRLAPTATGLRDSKGRSGAAMIHGQKARWVEYGGVRITDDPSNAKQSPHWYAWSEGMHYFSPALLFAGPLELPAGGELRVAYRIEIL